MQLRELGLLRQHAEPLVPVSIPVPEPAAPEVLVKVSACGVCHTEIDEIEGRTPPASLPMVPGHEVVGRVVRLGTAVTSHALGDRVGIGWIFSSSGDEQENISKQFLATGRDVNGGYAEYMTVHADYAHKVPGCFSDFETAPLLCAGSVGYRALMLGELANGDILGLTGFGGSGHLVLQTVRFLYPDSPVYVFARNAAEREFAMELGASWAGDTNAMPPRRPHVIIDTTPAWRPVLAALKCLRPGGRLVINAIRKEDRDKSIMAKIDYAEHLWQEKRLMTVANVTGNDIREFLQVAAEAGINPEVQIYKLEDANTALLDLRNKHVRGAKVLAIGAS